MIRIKKFTFNCYQEICYVAHDETLECIVIDCGASNMNEFQDISRYIHNNGLTPKHLIATHAHIDHNIGNKMFYDEFGLLVEIYEKDKMLADEFPFQAKFLMKTELPTDFPKVGTHLTDSSIIAFGKHAFNVIPTPGHSPGSIFLYCPEEKIAFSGDTLFKGSIGRTDFLGGSMFQIIQSLRKISQLPDNTRILPGHGDETTIGIELAKNPYLDR